jgi:hypothetical protein
MNRRVDHGIPHQIGFVSAKKNQQKLTVDHLIVPHQIYSLV